LTASIKFNDLQQAASQDPQAFYTKFDELFSLVFEDVRMTTIEPVNLRVTCASLASITNSTHLQRSSSLFFLLSSSNRQVSHSGAPFGANPQFIPRFHDFNRNKQEHDVANYFLRLDGRSLLVFIRPSKNGANLFEEAQSFQHRLREYKRCGLGEYVANRLIEVCEARCVPEPEFRCGYSFYFGRMTRSRPSSKWIVQGKASSSY
jgi:hypothetical protein